MTAPSRLVMLVKTSIQEVRSPSHLVPGLRRDVGPLCVVMLVETSIQGGKPLHIRILDPCHTTRFTLSCL